MQPTNCCLCSDAPAFPRHQYGGIRLAVMLALLAVLRVPFAQAAATVTTLTLSSSGVSSGTLVTFTASVSNGSQVTKGLVTFCDATAIYCEDSAIIGSAQLTATGTAAIKLVPGIGDHSYKATFNGTTSDAPSTSSVQSLTVTGTYPTATTISSSGSADNYTLTATVVATGSASLLPTGSVSFVDTTSSYVVGSATLGTAIVAQAFGPQVSYPTGSGPSSVAVGDFNQDGKTDLAVANSFANTVSVLMGNGDGTFQPQTAYAIGTSPASVAVADFNADGFSDLVVANNRSNTVSVLLGMGDGTFQPQVAYTVGPNTWPISVAIGDFNADGVPDLAVGDRGSLPYPSSVSVLMGNGDGTFQGPYILGSGIQTVTSVAIGDLNGDGKNDLAVAWAEGVRLMFEDANGNLQLSPDILYMGNNAVWVGIGDFNADGKADLAVTNPLENTISLVLGIGNGTFQQCFKLTTGGAPGAAEIGDFNADGEADLAVANSWDNTVGVHLGNGIGGFQPQVTYATGGWPASVAAGDFNGDGMSDLVVANNSDNTVSVLLNRVTQTATAVGSGISIPGAGTHQVGASYSGDTNFGSSTSSTIPLTASAVPTALALSANPASSSADGQSVTLTATLSPAAAGNMTTTGESVIFKSGASTVGTGTLDLGVAMLTLTTLPVGTNSLTAAYAGDANFLASTSSALIFTVKATPVIVWATPAPITYGISLGGALNATAVYGATSVPGSFSYTAAPQGGSAVGVNSATVLGAGSYTLTATFVPTDTTTFASAEGSVSLTIAKAAPSVTLTSSANAVMMKTTVTLTATVSSSSGTPSGSVNFYDGTTVVGSSTLAQGVATLTTSSLGAGTHPVTAAYSGDSNFSPLSSSAVMQTVQDFSLGMAAGSSTSVTVHPGGTTGYVLAITPTNGTTLPAAVTLVVSGLPTGAVATITPQTVSAGAGATNIALSIQVSNQTASFHYQATIALALSFGVPGLLLLPFGRGKRHVAASHRRIVGLLLIALAGTTLLGLIGCGGGGSAQNGGSGPQGKSYSLTVYATSGALSHSTTLNLTIQ